MRRGLVALCAFLVLAPAAHAATASAAPRQTENIVVGAFLADGKVASWLKRFPHAGLRAQATFQPQTHSWTIYIGSEKAGVMADGSVDDNTALVTEAWTGPQVVWTMARGRAGAFGGRWINSWPVWLGFCLVFLLGLADLRRLLSWRNVDLLVLLSFSISLAFFNRGHIFASVSLAYPPLVYLLARCCWIGFRGRSPTASAPVWPVWALVAMTLVLVGVRGGISIANGNVIDVGYSGIVGAQRIATGHAPYGHFPVDGAPCGPASSDGVTRGRLQANGRCEVPKPEGDTYGPVVYESYLPGYWLFGWSGQQDSQNAARFTAFVFDIICLSLLALLGRRLGGARLAATLGFAWASFPFTLYALGSSTNDDIVPAFLLAGLLLAAYPWARGASLALSTWAKFVPLVLAPLWLSYPDGLSKPKAKGWFAGGFVVATVAAFSILLFEPSLSHALSVFYHRTIHFQLSRSSPFSIWDWRQFNASGLPNLHFVQQALEVLVVAAAVALYFVPRKKSLLQLTALTAALLLAVQVVMTHWFYLYIPWFFPFVALSFLVAPAPPATGEQAALRPSFVN